MKSFNEKVDKCRNCHNDLNHDYFTAEELEHKKSKGMNLGKNQRLSFCEKCEIEYINSKF